MSSTLTQQEVKRLHRPIEAGDSTELIAAKAALPNVEDTSSTLTTGTNIRSYANGAIAYTLIVIGSGVSFAGEVMADKTIYNSPTAPGGYAENGGLSISIPDGSKVLVILTKKVTPA